MFIKSTHPSNLINTISGSVVQLHIYKICVLQSLVTIESPWEIEDVAAWVSEVEIATRIQEVICEPIFITSVNFNENTDWVGPQMAQYNVEIPEEYDYVKYSAVGPSHQALSVFRATVYVDRERLRTYFDYIYADVSLSAS